MGPSFAEIRADEIQVSTAIVASTRTGGPFEPARCFPADQIIQDVR